MPTSIDVRRRSPLNQTHNDHSQSLNCHFQIVSRKLATQTGLAESPDHPNLRAGCVWLLSEHFLQQHLGWLLEMERHLLQLANGWLCMKQHDSSLVVPSLQNQHHLILLCCAIYCKLCSVDASPAAELEVAVVSLHAKG